MSRNSYIEKSNSELEHATGPNMNYLYIYTYLFINDVRRRHLDIEGRANTWNNQSRTADKGWSSSFGIGRGVTTRRSEKVAGYEMLHWLRTWTDFVWNDLCY
jgi:hypothetical protein